MIYQTVRQVPAATQFTGVPHDMLERWLIEAQDARHKLETGMMPMSVNYGTGSGQKMVSFSKAQLPALRRYIEDLQRALGRGQRRQAMRPHFG